MIEAAFMEQFEMVVRVDPADLIPATGAWRTNKNLDVYSWEGSGLWMVDGQSGGANISIDSWDTMTRLVRSGGVSLTRERMTGYEVYEKKGTSPGG